MDYFKSKGIKEVPHFSIIHTYQFYRSHQRFQSLIPPSKGIFLKFLFTLTPSRPNSKKQRKTESKFWCNAGRTSNIRAVPKERGDANNSTKREDKEIAWQLKSVGTWEDLDLKPTVELRRKKIYSSAWAPYEKHIENTAQTNTMRSWPEEKGNHNKTYLHEICMLLCAVDRLIPSSLVRTFDKKQNKYVHSKPSWWEHGAETIIA